MKMLYVYDFAARAFWDYMLFGVQVIPYFFFGAFLIWFFGKRNGIGRRNGTKAKGFWKISVAYCSFAVLFICLSLTLGWKRNGSDSPRSGRMPSAFALPTSVQASPSG